jgi:hypothetical protein
MSMEASVAIVVDAAFGDALLELSSRMPVWICGTSVNLQAAEKCRKSVQPPPDVTTFNVGVSESPEAMFLGVLADVDLHHGEHSKEFPWTNLHVLGVGLTPAIRNLLSEYGIQEFSNLFTGFQCTRGAHGVA